MGKLVQLRTLFPLVRQERSIFLLFCKLKHPADRETRVSADRRGARRTDSISGLPYSRWSFAWSPSSARVGCGPAPWVKKGTPLKGKIIVAVGETGCESPSSRRVWSDDPVLPTVPSPTQWVSSLWSMQWKQIPRESGLPCFKHLSKSGSALSPGVARMAGRERAAEDDMNANSSCAHNIAEISQKVKILR